MILYRSMKEYVLIYAFCRSRSAIFFCRGPESKCFQLLTLWSLLHLLNCALCRVKAATDNTYMNEQDFFNKTLFVKTDGKLPIGSYQRRRGKG